MSNLTAAATERIMRRALLSRAVDETLLELYSTGKVMGTIHTCIGQELSGAVLAEFIQPGDALFSSHRCHGHFLSVVGDTAGLVAEIMGRASGVCGGRGGSQHLCRGGFYSNGVQGGGVPLASGVALAHQLAGNGSIAVSIIGDGTLGEGVVYESLNIASKWRLPLLIVVEDNGYAQSTSKEETLAGDILARASAFGLESARADTWNWERLYETAQRIIAHVRAGGGPAVLLVETFRLKAHSKGDDNRPAALVAEYAARDPINCWLAEPNHPAHRLRDSVHAEVDAAVARAELSPPPHYVPAPPMSAALEWSTGTLPSIRICQAIHDVLATAMARDERVVLVGEDVRAPYGGAFKVSRTLSDAHPDRVRNTPISEAAIVGVGTGLALAGYRPIVEIMFGDFLGLAFDQLLNHASKFEDMYNAQVEVNLIVRTPMGGGRGYGPTHSQTLDKHFLGIPGLRVLALNSLISPSQLYEPLFTAHCGPTLVIENKRLYAMDLRHELPAGFVLNWSSDTCPTAWVRPDAERADVTLVGYGGMSDTMIDAAEQLFEADDIVAQVVCLGQVYPCDVRSLLPVLLRAPHLVIVEEGQGFAGFGAEFVSQLAELQPATMPTVRRVSAAPTCIPASDVMEREVLPGLDNIIAACVHCVTMGAAWQR